MSKAKNVINEMDDERKERLARQEIIYAIHRKYYKRIENAINSLEKGLEGVVVELVGIEDDVTIISSSVAQLCSQIELEAKYLTKRMTKTKVKELMKK